MDQSNQERRPLTPRIASTAATASISTNTAATNTASAKIVPTPIQARIRWARGSNLSLSQQIRRARIWLPLLIVCVVISYEIYIIPLGGPTWNLWAHVLFYGILGPAVTFVTLTWIAAEVLLRERAQEDLENLYGELQASHELLATIQDVTEQFASATDLESVLQAASKGISEATGAVGAIILIGERELTVTRSYGLDSELEQDAHTRNASFLRAGSGYERQTGERQYDGQVDGHTVLSAVLAWSGKLEGSVHAYYSKPPSAEQRESFAILTSEFSAVTEATRSRTRDLMTLFNVDRSIRAEGNLERLLSTLLDQAIVRADALAGGVYLADDEDQLLRLRTFHGLTGKLNTVTHALHLGDSGCISGAARRGEACISHALTLETRQGPVLEGAGSALCLPLVFEDELLGIVVLAHNSNHHFDKANLTFLSLLANQVTLAVRNARAYLQSEELAISEERARIAREIHDGVAQSLASSALQLDLIARLIHNPDKALDKLKQVKTVIREAIREVRRSIFALHPIDLERHGFIETVRRYSHDYGQQNDIAVEVSVDMLPELTVKSEAVLFRIFQEAMNNVAKHAKASQVSVSLGTDKLGHAFVEVCDNGVGFDRLGVSDRVTSAGGLGLKQMRERIEGRGGVFVLETQQHGPLDPALQNIPDGILNEHTAALQQKQGTRVYAALPQ
ncbi:MAG: GAF domain-containing sensor histidine kinase [Deinococcota bacterium]